MITGHHHVRKPQYTLVTRTSYSLPSFPQFVRLRCIGIPEFSNSDGWSRLAQTDPAGRDRVQTPTRARPASHVLLTESAETRSRPHVTLFSSQLQSPNAFSDTSEPAWGRALWAGCWAMSGFCVSSSLVVFMEKLSHWQREHGGVRHC